MDFCLLQKNMGTQLSRKYGQKPLDSANKSATDAIKNASKRTIQKTAEATGDLTDKKIADKITSVSKKSKKPKVMKLMMNQKHQKKDTYLQKKDNKLLMN